MAALPLAEAGLNVVGLEAGSRYAVTTAVGDRLEGEVILNRPPREFGGTAENLGNSLFRFGVEGHTGQNQAFVWLSVWGDRERAGAFVDRWNTALSGLFGR